MTTRSTIRRCACSNGRCAIPMVCFLSIDGDFAHVVHHRPHHTHAPLRLPHGLWEVRRQREWISRGAIRTPGIDPASIRGTAPADRPYNDGMDLKLSGKIAVVTAASKGIGLAVVGALVEEGARVVAGARNIGSIRRWRV